MRSIESKKTIFKRNVTSFIAGGAVVFSLAPLIFGANKNDIDNKNSNPNSNPTDGYIVDSEDSMFIISEKYV